MKYLAIVPRTLWKTLFLLNFLLGLIILYPAFKLFLSKEKWFKICFKLMRFWAKWILFIPMIWIKHIEGSYRKKIKGPVIFVANHQSYLDIIMLYCLFDTYFVSVGKVELRKIPLFRILFEKMNIAVERGSLVESHRSFLEMDKRIKKGESVFLFPEGTINKRVPAMKDFKNGAFKLAIENQIPIVPITFLTNWKLLQNGGFLKSNGRPGMAYVKVHHPIETKGLTMDNLVSLREQTHQIIEEPIKLKNEY